MRSWSLLWLFLPLAAALSCRDDAQRPSPSTFPTSTAPNPPGAYRQYRLDPRHAGASPPAARLTLPLALAWRSATFGIGTYSASKSSPAVDETAIYVGSDNGELIALSRSTGSVLWRFRTRRYPVELASNDPVHFGIHGSPALDEHNVYIGDYAGYLYAVDKQTGVLVWESLLGGSIGASPVLLGDFIFISVELANADGRVFIVRASSGETVWYTPGLGDFAHASVTVDAPAGHLYVGANNGILFCFDYWNRIELWAFQTDGAIKSTAALAGDALYLTSWDSHLYVLDSARGLVRARVAATAASMSSPAVADNTAFFGADDGVFYAVDAQTTERRWAFATQGPILSSPTVVVDSSLVVVGSRDRHVYVFELSTGELRQALLLDRGVTSVPVVVDDWLFVNDDGGTVYAFRSASD